MNSDNVNLDWASLPFGYHRTDYNVRCVYRNGEWGEIEVHTSEEITLHMAASCLHYGQEAFEGQKAFRGVDGRIRLFRIEENARRFADSARGIAMQPMPEELFIKMARMAIKLNERWMPPYGSGCSLYLRPIELGITPRVGVSAADEYVVIMFVTPVGAYFKNGFSTSKVVIYREYDRAAPQGTGRWKVGGNYAGGMVATMRAKKDGYSAVLFLDPKEKKYLDECGPANFFAIKGDAYVTPKSNSILPSVTNKSLQQIAKDMGLRVECRPVPVEELAEFDEAAECGTAAVAAPISQVDDVDRGVSYVIARDNKPGPVITKLYKQLQAIQYGESPDPYGWCTFIDND